MHNLTCDLVTCIQRSGNFATKIIRTSRDISTIYYYTNFLQILPVYLKYVIFSLYARFYLYFIILERRTKFHRWYLVIVIRIIKFPFFVALTPSPEFETINHIKGIIFK